MKGILSFILMILVIYFVARVGMDFVNKSTNYIEKEGFQSCNAMRRR